MTAIRQDAWTADDDLILAEVTLRHIREGSTQLAAFEEVGEKIGRTSAACGFRWNSCVRKKYEAAIQLAKAQRQKRNYLKKQPLGAQVASLTLQEGEDADLKGEMLTEESLSMDMVIRYLRQMRNNVQEMTRQIKHMEKELQEKEEYCARLQRENEELSKQVNVVETDYRTVNDDYKALIQIMDRARRLAILSEEDDDVKTRFRMDANGNLERIE
ncbi:RsfA family transcriptional regulator [Paenibacillus melissococcoides]|uniref:RsfA family transcriptional regulator n=1 Tax=Paenibacillus melissococcoides TaxID=2912268 RepID=A0ABM9G0S3_9BACL|nr:MULTISPECIES: RsfA family transcriptional regulator [Paenibacillus]MEB9893066.1 RsfA family transcriptional regulator [Bacillus cereus]CAH8245221.1 RsfA family transcriptional regulator [Paenibacillus melissococcoides]CAH8710331.1 RsfA family transcriptional regulator [Paenibacillus melissococcoides]CAH8711100.1 RsfA family transcriptional regulator [Paenibacillus melissococcoides]GIO78898.1 transcriptional regulator [Paenibacillus dendritiformis]